MGNVEIETQVRAMVWGDLDGIIEIDHKLRATSKIITYANLPTERIFSINVIDDRLSKPVSYTDLIRKDMSGLLEFSLVAEVKGHICGFILGQVAYVQENDAQEGVILILGVDPDYWRRGIATQLINAFCEKLQNKGIKAVRMVVNRRDKPLLDFVERIGFGESLLIDYTKAL